jgi:HSP20 family protein
LFAGVRERLADDHWQPSIDVFETEGALVVRVEIAGLRTEDMNVRIDGDMLRIQGERRVPEEAGLQRLHRMEIAFGRFERSLQIQVPFDRSGVSAHLEDGFLRVVLPKRTPTRVRVDVETE